MIHLLPHHQQIVHLVHPMNALGQFRRAILGKFRFDGSRKGNLTLEGVNGDCETAEIRIIEDLAFDGCRNVHVIENLARGPACGGHAGAEAEDQQNSRQQVQGASPT